MELNQEWCAYFAGFVDGEGCFDIHKGSPRFRIKLRDDDLSILEEFKQQLNVGRIQQESRSACLEVYGKNCQRIIEALDGRLRAKKKEDYLAWKPAAEAAYSKTLTKKLLSECKERIKEVREYKCLH